MAELAFPLASDNYRESQPGMTLRDYFASAVLPALVASGSACSPTVDRTENNLRSARAAYSMADAMLQARRDR